MMTESIAIPQLLQAPTEAAHSLGQTVMETGLWMAPAGFAMLALSPISSMLLTRYGGRITLALGAVMAIVLTSQTITLPAGGGTVPTQNAFLLCFGIGAAVDAAPVEELARV